MESYSYTHTTSETNRGGNFIGTKCLNEGKGRENLQIFHSSKACKPFIIDPSYPLVAEVNTAKRIATYMPLKPGSLYHVMRGNSLPPSSKVDLDAV